MASIVQTAIRAAHKSQLRVQGEGITYFSGLEAIEVQAIRGSTKWDAEQAETGVTIEERSVDWLIDKTLLAAAGITPGRGDSITDENGVTYRLMPFGNGEQVWRWHDRANTIYRIFSKERT